MFQSAVCVLFSDPSVFCHGLICCSVFSCLLFISFEEGGGGGGGKGGGLGDGGSVLIIQTSVYYEPSAVIFVVFLVCSKYLS